MNKFETPPPVKLVCGILYLEGAPLESCVDALQQAHGEMDFRSSPLLFEYTDYYHKEMGEPLYRVFVSFRRLVRSEALRSIKLFTGELERKYSVQDGRRVINLDPGYLSAAAFVLSSSKNYAHRIHLGDGVYAQQELLFERKGARTLDWTYPDYRSFEYQQMLLLIRRQYLLQLKNDAEIVESTG